VGGPAPADYVEYASIAIDVFAPGAYRIEAYGRDRVLHTTQRYFAIDALVPTAMPVIEYYNEFLDHYFLAGGPDEVALLDAGANGGWKRTGQKLAGWLHQAEAPANAKPVCRFYALGPNSHFFTADASECQSLKVLEQSQRAQAAASGSAFLGWAYEGIGFWALVPINGQCPGGSAPIYRAYNNRAVQNDSNHRFTRSGLMHQSMTASWFDEGVQLCSPG
jgi:serine protease